MYVVAFNNSPRILFFHRKEEYSSTPMRHAFFIASSCPSGCKFESFELKGEVFSFVHAKSHLLQTKEEACMDRQVCEMLPLAIGIYIIYSRYVFARLES